GVIGVDQQRELDLGGGDGTDVDALLGQCLECLGGDAGMAAHPNADHRDLGYVVGSIQPLVADLRLGFDQNIGRALVIAGGNREGDVGGGAVAGDVLHDHIDV